MTNGISFFGATIITTGLLRKSKADQEGHESFQEKVARDNFASRVHAVRHAMNFYGGATKEAAEHIRYHWFTDVDVDTLTEWLKEGIEDLGKPINMPKVAFGNLEFEIPEPVALPGLDDCEEDDDDGDWDDEPY